MNSVTQVAGHICHLLEGVDRMQGSWRKIGAPLYNITVNDYNWRYYQDTHDNGDVSSQG